MAAPLFDSDRVFPFDLGEGADRGGSRWPVRFVIMPSGREQRIKLSMYPRREYAVDMASRTPAMGDVLVAFWEASAGGWRGFRARDLDDFEAVNEPLTPDGTASLQLVKTYTSGSVSRVRPIYAPVVSPAITIRKNAGAFAAYTLNTATGLVTLTAVLAKAITAITQAASAVATVGAAHGFAVNDRVQVTGVSGMLQINNLVGTVSATAATTITLSGINSSGFSAYTSGGVATKYMTTTDTFDWSGEFSVPVRFDLQVQEMEMISVGERQWMGIRLIELVGS